MRDDSCNCSPLQVDSMRFVSFCGTYSLTMSTKSSSIIPLGIEALILAYEAGDNPITKSTYPGTPIQATSDTNGTLVLNNGGGLLMPAGNYDFYSVSSNSALSSEITFNKGVSNRLSNGIDYLWASKTNTSVASNTNVTLEFEHKATAIALEIVAGYGVETLSVKSIKIGRSNDGASLHISSGFIPVASDISGEMYEMSLYYNKGISIMLPLAEGIQIPIEVVADVRCGNNIISNIYKASIPSQAGGYQSGTIYLFKASIDVNSISFNNALLNEWNEESLETIFINEL